MERVVDNSATLKQRLEHAISLNQIGGGFTSFIGHKMVYYVYGTDTEQMSYEEIAAILHRNHII